MLFIIFKIGGAFDSAKNHKRQFVTAKREKSQTPKFVEVRLGEVRLGKVSIAVMTFGVCDFSRLAVTDWRLLRWRLWFLALMTAILKLDTLINDTLPSFFRLSAEVGSTKARSRARSAWRDNQWGSTIIGNYLSNGRGGVNVIPRNCQ